MFNINTTRKLTKLKIAKQQFVIVILTTSTILKNFKKIATLKESTTLNKSIKLKETKIEDIQFMLREEFIYF